METVCCISLFACVKVMSHGRVEKHVLLASDPGLNHSSRFSSYGTPGNDLTLLAFKFFIIWDNIPTLQDFLWGLGIKYKMSGTWQAIQESWSHHFPNSRTAFTTTFTQGFVSVSWIISQLSLISWVPASFSRCCVGNNLMPDIPQGIGVCTSWHWKGMDTGLGIGPTWFKSAISSHEIHLLIS